MAPYNTGGIPRRESPVIPQSIKKRKSACRPSTSGLSKKRNITFQKKLFVYQYMLGSPSSFTRSESLFCCKGLLPPISVTATEGEVRQEILRILHMEISESLDIDNFEFINMCGKSGNVPKVRPDFEWTGRAVKELAGSGAVYIRLTVDMDVEFPSVDVIESSSYASHSPLNLTSHSPSASQSPSTSHASSTPITFLLPASTSQEPSSSESLPMFMSTVPTASATHNQESVSDENDVILIEDKDNSTFSTLFEIFPTVCTNKLQFVYDHCSQSVNRTTDLILNGLHFETIRQLAASCFTIPLTESPRIRVHSDDDADDWMDAAISFYKKGFDKNSYVMLRMTGQPGVDTGGIRRQFFSVVFSEIAERFFEGPHNRLRPAFKASLLSSGLLTIIGTMIAHNILMDGQGFPYMADYVYYYIAGLMDKAVSCISLDDASQNVKFTIEEFLEATDLNSFEQMNNLLEFMERCGCDINPTLDNRDKIVDCILLDDVLNKRRIYFDAIAKGLDVMDLRRVLSLFPAEFKVMFVGDVNISTIDRVKNCLKPSPIVNCMDEDELRVWGFFMSFIDTATEKNLNSFLQFVCGSSNAVGKIAVSFDDSGEDAIVTSTCSRNIKFSKSIKDKDLFITALAVIIPETSFTMP
jgi:hypothetical protein